MGQARKIATDHSNQGDVGADNRCRSLLKTQDFPRRRCRGLPGSGAYLDVPHRSWFSSRPLIRGVSLLVTRCPFQKVARNLEVILKLAIQLDSCAVL